MTTKEALDHLEAELIKDEDYRRAWFDNLTMAFYDAIRTNPGTDHDKATEGAERFMHNLFGGKVKRD